MREIVVDEKLSKELEAKMSLLRNGLKQASQVK